MAREINPIALPSGVKSEVTAGNIKFTGSKGSINMSVHTDIEVALEDEKVTIKAVRQSKNTIALLGTTQALVKNMLAGVSVGFERKLELVGVGYRAQAQGTTLNLTLGFSHPINYVMPEGITVETPSQTQVILKGIDKQKVGQVAAEIRAFRPPEPYKGKGVRYEGERIIRKEAKKK